MFAESRGKEKRLLTDELVTMKKDKDRLQRELTRRDEQLLEAKSEVDRSILALKNAETKINTLKAQVRHEPVHVFSSQTLLLGLVI